MPTFVIPSVLRRYAPAEVAVAGKTVRDAIEDLLRQHPDLRIRLLDASGRVHPYLQLFVDNVQTTDLDAPAGAVLEFVGAAEGG